MKISKNLILLSILSLLFKVVQTNQLVNQTTDHVSTIHRSEHLTASHLNKYSEIIEKIKPKRGRRKQNLTLYSFFFKNVLELNTEIYLFFKDCLWRICSWSPRVRDSNAMKDIMNKAQQENKTPMKSLLKKMLLWVLN